MAASPKRREKGVVVRRVGKETVVFDTASDVVTCLDLFTASVWAAADGATHEAALAAGLGVPQLDVDVALERLGAAGLLQIHGLTRRGLLRGAAGVAAAVPLASVLAPAPAFAASGETVNDATVTASADTCQRNSLTGVGLVSTNSYSSTVSFTLAKFDAGTGVAVQAKDGGGNVLGETSVTTDAAGGTTGTFQVTLSEGTNTFSVHAVSSTENAQSDPLTVSCS